MTQDSDNREFNRLMFRAYIRDGKTIHTGESVMLACLIHTKGAGRQSKDMRDIQRLLNDPNLDD